VNALASEDAPCGNERRAEVKAPVVIAEGSNVTIYQSVEEAERSVGPRDAVSGRVRAWDADGRRLRFDIDDALCLDLAQVSLSGAPNAPRDLEGLRSILLTLFVTDEGDHLNGLSVDDLIRRALNDSRPL
jgi:hypothetical protein